MATSITALLGQILIPQRERPEILFALRGAAADFCRRTLAWRVTFFATLSGGESSRQFTLDPSLNACILRSLSVSIDDGTDKPKTLDRRQYSMDGSGLFSWTEWAPRSGDVLTVEAALSPKANCSDFPDSLIQNHGAAIVAKAKADLLRTPVAGWSAGDSEKARALSESDYERLCAKASREGGKGSATLGAAPNLAGTYGPRALTSIYGRIGGR